MTRPIFLYTLAAVTLTATAWAVYRALYPPAAADASGAAASGIESALYSVQNVALDIMGTRMKTSDAGLQQIATIEGFSAMPYADAGGYSIGYGHFLLPGESYPQGIDQAGALSLLASDVVKAEDAVNSLVAVPITQAQFDALVSFVYNVGAGAFRGSTLLSKLNAGDVQGAADQFAVWNKEHKGGNLVVNEALVNRRQTEVALFTFGTYA